MVLNLLMENNTTSRSVLLHHLHWTLCKVSQMLGLAASWPGYSGYDSVMHRFLLFFVLAALSI